MRLREHEQFDKRESHFCDKYKTKILHMDAHPELYRCVECLEKGIDGLEADGKFS